MRAAVVHDPQNADSSSGTSFVPTGFPRLAWASVLYTLCVVLFGAIVRITGSGAGCGQHWPTCHGEIAHLPRTIETAIELTHRLTSGLSLIFVLIVLIAAFKQFPKAHRVRRAAVWAFAFILVEAAVGAGLVLLELVGTDASMARAVVMPIHLLSTSVLMAALTLSAWWSVPNRSATVSPLPSLAKWLLFLGALGVLLVSATGAVTALGDTVYPVHSSGLSGRLVEDHGAGAHFLQRLRWIHPIVAVSVAVFLFYVGSFIAGRADDMLTRRISRWLMAAIFIQIVLGVTNVWLSAPGWMQVVHLAAANIVWILLVLLGARVVGSSAPTATVSQPAT